MWGIKWGACSHVRPVLFFLIMKRCSRCKEILPKESFYKDDRHKDGLFSCCKKCYKQYYQNNNKQYYRNNSEKIKERSRQWRKNNPEKAKEYYQNNSEKIKKRQKQYRQNNSEKIKERREREISFNKEYWRDYGKNYRKNLSPEKKREYGKVRHNNRRARLSLNGGKFTSKEWKDVLEKHNYKCAVCGGTEPFLRQFYMFLTVDHIIPLKKGGKNIKENIQPLCSNCNRKKGAF